MKFALIQQNSEFDKEESIAKAGKNIDEAAKAEADIIVLPEMWNCPYANRYFREYSEPAGGKTFSFLSDKAAEHGAYIIGGTIPESREGKIYNTCFSFDRKGRHIGTYSKTHLFDVTIGGKIAFQESKTLASGDCTTVIDTEFCKIGIGICYDVRFPEMFRKMALEGAKIIVLPAAFNENTGKAHWDIIMRTRAVDNQVYFIPVSPGKNPAGVYVAHGHTMMVDPWGQVISEAGEGEEIIYGVADTGYVDKVREELPLLKQRRPELYSK